MAEQDNIETEDADVEGHRVAVNRNAEPEGEDNSRTRTASDESDDPDVEGHRHHGGV